MIKKFSGQEWFGINERRDDGTGPATHVGDRLQIIKDLVELDDTGKGLIVLDDRVNKLMTAMPDGMPSMKEKFNQFLKQINELDRGDAIDVVYQFLDKEPIFKLMVLGKIDYKHSKYFGKAGVIPVQSDNRGRIDDLEDIEDPSDDELPDL